MNDHELDLALEAIGVRRTQVTTPSALRERVLAVPVETPLRWSWLPRIHEGGFDMFSALKFIAAGVIVAFFGGFLLTGIFTTQQGDEMAPAAVTESPSPMTSVRSDILPGVNLTVEEVEPGVYRVRSDGVRDLAPYLRERTDPTWLDLSFPAVVAGSDGSVWIPHRDGLFRVGVSHTPSIGDEHGGLYWPYDQRPLDLDIASDGTVWATIETGAEPEEGRTESGVYLWSLVGDEWELHEPPLGGAGIEVTADGAVWATYPEGGDWANTVFGYLGADGWTTVGEWPFVGLLQVSEAGDIWSFGHIMGPLERFVDGAWQPYPEPGGMDLGPREGDFGHFDGTEWTTFPRAEWMPEHRGDWVLVDDAWEPVPLGMEGDESISGEGVSGSVNEWSDLRLAPDGSAWIAVRLGMWGEGRPVCDLDMDGVARFGEETWSRHLRGYCVEAMDVASDGSVWALATEADARYPVRGLYVITPEAVEARE